MGVPHSSLALDGPVSQSVAEAALLQQVPAPLRCSRGSGRGQDWAYCGNPTEHAFHNLANTLPYRQCVHRTLPSGFAVLSNVEAIKR